MGKIGGKRVQEMHLLGVESSIDCGDRPKKDLLAKIDKERSAKVIFPRDFDILIVFERTGKLNIW